MILSSTDFDGYIGIKVFGQISGRPASEVNGMEKIPVTVQWFEVISKSFVSSSAPDWSNPQRVPELAECNVYIPSDIVNGTNVDAIHEYFRDATGSYLNDIEDHFCSIGQCKINPRHCPKGA